MVSMSTLSQAEQTAGISRRALETLAGRNGRKTVSEIISGFRATRVIDSPMRMLDVLESNLGDVLLRATEYTDTRAVVTIMHFDYHEAHALASVLRELEPPDESPKKGSGRA
jgi:hypothetical protein